MPIKTVDAPTLRKWIENDEAILIDVRETAEHQAGTIPGAVLMPLLTVSKERLPPVNKKIVVYCRSGIRSQHACGQLLNEDPQLDLYNLEGGIMAWAFETFTQ